ncbi:nucleoside/nucleotide kinase family protein [Tranquillimonas alkanivorans]|uniref:Panthothenate kinase n=1 Tax=Tranquillimonas alkanivorans TaxID=441119 RepID=A0A1I5RYV5_9RHOB|nr:nucleoside/nucleotide kinase family protein [Tranquillimonas alkanivorans]SFP63672.1 hypothetical protein SAMN04488047_109158 [Tranquillimonas alkanivorans]
MTETVTFDALLARLLPLARGEHRRLVAVAGPPAAGKSHVAELLHARLEEDAPGCSAVLPMDGFHFDDMLLSARGDLPRKGAPHTFDTGGLVSTLSRIAADDGQSVAVPVFDRAIEIARAGARMIGPEARLILVEGNYLLLDDPEWRTVTSLFDLTVMVDAPEEVLAARLAARWSDLSPDLARRKVEENDLPNARLVLRQSRPADLRLSSD